MTGTVTRVYHNRTDGKPRPDGTKDRGGYFFVRDPEGHDRFAHARDIGQQEFLALREGVIVEFEPVKVEGGRGNGLRAEKVRVIK